MSEKIKGGLAIFLSLVLSLISGGIIFYFWQPIASWYFNYRPILGVDFYNFASYVGFFQRHFVWPFNGWKYIWWSGGPIYFDYPTLHMYLTLPLLNYFSLLQAIQIYMLGSTFLFLFFSYLLFHELAKERVLPLVLTIASSFSIGLYGALVWGGSLPYFATQMFLPLVLWFLVRFFKDGSGSSLFTAGLFLGISLLGHPQMAFSYLLPIAILLFIAYSIKSGKKLIFPRLKQGLTFLALGLLVGFPSLYLFVGLTPHSILIAIPQTISRLFRWTESNSNASVSAPSPSAAGSNVYTAADYNRDQLIRFWNDTNPLIFYLLALSMIIFIITFLLRRKKILSLNIFFFALPVLWVVFYISLYGFNIPLMHGGWYRVFWPLPLSFGILISFIWGDFWEVLSQKLENIKNKIWLILITKVIFGLLILIFSFNVLSQSSSQKMLKNIDHNLYRQQSSAYPDSLGMETQQNNLEGLRKNLVPSWLEPNDTQYRFYDADQRVNIWWNAFYDMPLVKGYIEFPPGDSVLGSYYWLSAGLTASGGTENTLVKQWGVPEETAYNNVLFLLDWFSIKYLEAEHERSDSYNPFASYIRNSDIFAKAEKVIMPGWADLYYLKKNETGPIRWRPDLEEYLSYYQVKEELVTPIIYPTNALTLGIVGRQDAYSTIIRNLGGLNLNSKHIIPIWLDQFIDDVSSEDLKAMDALILYTYDYHNYEKSWGKIERYIKDGGKVLVETGSDVKQTKSESLPTIFPMEKTKKEQMGSSWNLSGNSEETNEIDFGKFGPPVLDDDPWVFSLPSHSTFKNGTKVILSNKSIPLIVQRPLGKGLLIWSGMNLPYHISTHKSVEELKFFKVILDRLIQTEATEIPEFNAKRVSPTQIKIVTQNAKGILFKENMSPGWQAKLSSNINKNLKIYKTGITFNGYAYVRLPQRVRDSFTVTFSYQGYFWSYFWSTVSFLTILFILDKVILGGRTLNRGLEKLLKPFAREKEKMLQEEEDY